jgi:hypothetical protein
MTNYGSCSKGSGDLDSPICACKYLQPEHSVDLVALVRCEAFQSLRYHISIGLQKGFFARNAVRPRWGRM